MLLDYPSEGSGQSKEFHQMKIINTCFRHKNWLYLSGKIESNKRMAINVTNHSHTRKI